MKTIQSLFISACLAIGTCAAPAYAQSSLPAAAALASSRVGLLVRLDANKGMEDEIAKLLMGAKAIVDAEPATATWYAMRLSPTSFGIFDTFATDAARDAHLTGGVPAALSALMSKYPNLLERPPVIEKIDILAIKLPQ